MKILNVMFMDQMTVINATYSLSKICMIMMAL